MPYAFRSGSVRHKFLLRKNSYGLAASLNMLNHLGEQFIGASVTSTINPLAEASYILFGQGEECRDLGRASQGSRRGWCW